MFREIEPLREVLRKWCPSTHTFFFAWGELTVTLEDIANHWMLPILGEHSFSGIKLSAEEEEVAAALRRHSSTRINSWPALFVHREEISVRRATFILYWLCKCIFGNSLYYAINTLYIPLVVKISTGHCFPLAPLFLGHLYSQLDLFHDCKVEGDSCHILLAAFNITVLQTFFWEHSVNYLFVAKDKVTAWSKFSDLPQCFLDRFPDFRDNLPLVYRWVDLKTHDHDLVAALDFEDNVLLRPYGDDYPDFACVSVLSWFNQPTSLIYDLGVEDHRSLAYLSVVSPGWLPILSAAGVAFVPYCPQRVKRQFGLDQDVFAGSQEAMTSSPDLAPFIKSRAFAQWEGEVSRIMVPSGHRFGFNTPSMNAYWQRLTYAMVEYVNIGRSDKTPISSHRKPQTSNSCLSPPSQSAIAYGNNQKLGFAEWDEIRGGWIVYTTHLPEGWRKSVNIVKERLIMPSKRGKGNKRDAPVDPAVEKGSKKPAHSPKKTPPKKTKVGKKSKSTTPVPEPGKESATIPTKQ
jgi:hypothetical protein